MIAHSRKLLKVSFKLTDGGGRARDVGGDSPDVSGGVAIRLIP
jgi:hypothetical protein